MSVPKIQGNTLSPLAYISRTMQAVTRELRRNQKSSNVQKEKNDKIDAKCITIYVSRTQDKPQYYKRLTKYITLKSEYNLYVPQYKGQMKDQKNCPKPNMNAR